MSTETRARRTTNQRPAEQQGGPEPLPRYDEQAEQSVLGAMMLSADASTEVLNLLRATDFYRPSHQDVFSAISDLAATGLPVDPITVGGKLRDRGVLDPVGGATYLHTLFSAVPTATNAVYYAELVADAASHRRAQEAVTRAQQLVRTADRDRLPDVLRQLVDELQAVAHTGAPAAPKYTPVDWTELFRADDLAPDWLIPDVLERGENGVVYAPAKTGKSLVTLDMMAALASGRARLGRPAADPLRVLYVDMENSRRDLHRRLFAMGYTPDDLDTLIYLSFPGLPPLDTLHGGTEMAGLVEHHAADVVVLDSTARVVDGSEQESDTYRALYRHTIRLLKPTGTTIIRVDNSGKDPTKGQRGSSAKADDIDVAWELTRVRGSTFRLRCTHSRSGIHPDQLHVERRHDPLRHLVVQAPGPVSTETLHPAVNALIDALDAGGAPNDVGRERARGYLPEGTRASNEDLAKAVSARKQRPCGGVDEDDGQGQFEPGWGS